MDVVTSNMISWCNLSGKMLKQSSVTLSVRMGFLWITVSILMSTFVHPALSEGCHQRAMTGCFEQYNSHIQHHLDNQDAHIYKGIDVEILRTICHSMQAAVHCTLRKCPGMSQDSLLEVLPSDLNNVIDLCVYPQIYEVYARNQFCLNRLKPNLQSCHDDYEAATQHLVGDIDTEHSPGVQPMCSEFSKLVTCIEESVSKSCSEEATSLVELLVRPSIKYSQFCPKLAPSTTTPTTTTVEPTKSHYRYRQEPSENVQDQLEYELSESGAQSKGVHSSMDSFLMVTTMVLTLMLTRLVHPV